MVQISFLKSLAKKEMKTEYFDVIRPPARRNDGTILRTYNVYMIFPGVQGSIDQTIFCFVE